MPCLRIGGDRHRHSRRGRSLNHRNVVQRPSDMSRSGGDPAIDATGLEQPPATIGVAAHQRDVGSLGKGSYLVIVRTGAGTTVGTHIRYKECTARCGRRNNHGWCRRYKNRAGWCERCCRRTGAWLDDLGRPRQCCNCQCCGCISIWCCCLTRGKITCQAAQKKDKNGGDDISVDFHLLGLLVDLNRIIVCSKSRDATIQKS